MAANASVTKFQRVLAALPPAIRAPIKAEVFQQAYGLAESMRFAVHRGETLNLWNSIRVEPSAFTPLRALVRAGGKLTTTGGAGNAGFLGEFMRAVRGGGQTYDYALANEFGTEKMAARPFFWPTYRAKKASIRRAIKATAVAEIGKMVPLK